METILIKAVQLILSLSILVIVHELGHFVFSKLFKVRVEKFYLFFHPWFTLFKYKPKNSDTEYGIGWLPLGGYVKISGMIDESMDKEAMAQPPKPWEFRTKPAWQRLLIMVGGALMNFILAFFIYALLVFAQGEEYLPLKNITMGLSYNQATLDAGFQTGDIPLSADGIDIEKLDTKSRFNLIEAKKVKVLRDNKETEILLPENFNKIIFDKEDNFIARYPFVVKEVIADSPAKKANLQARDSIIGINGERNMATNEIQAALLNYKEKEIILNLYRNGEELAINVRPNENGQIGVFLLYVSPIQFYETVKIEYNFFSAFPAGIRIGVQKIKDYLGQFKYLFSKEGAQNIGGFGTIGSIFPDSWDWIQFWYLTAFLSIMLGVMNLLPIPVLDGGHVLFLLYEVVSGRKPNEKFLEYAQMAGMIFLFGLLIYANGMDIFRAFFK